MPNPFVRVVLAWLATVAPIFARHGIYGEELIQPNTQASRDGHWTLAVDPTQRQGAGPADYVLAHDGTTSWQGRLPFTLIDAVVASNGAFAGYAFTEGLESSKGECLLATVGPDGAVRGRIAIPRTGPSGPDGGPEPLVLGVALAEDQGWWLARVWTMGSDDAEHVFWRVDLRTGARLHKLPFANWRKVGHRKFEKLERVEPLVGAPLIALHWRTTDLATSKTVGDGARFELIDLLGKSVWSLDLPGDYGPDDESNNNAAWERTRLALSIRNGTMPGHFSVVGAKDQQRIELAVARDGEQWQVKEVGRTSFELPLWRSRFDPDPSTPKLALRPSTVVDLGEAAQALELQSVRDGWIDRRGRVFLLDDETKSLHVFDAEGRRLALANVPPRTPPRMRPWEEACVEGPDGEFWARLTGGWQRFDNVGRAVDFVVERAATELPLVDGRMWTYDGKLALLAVDGTTIADHERRPDRRWFSRVEFDAPQALCGGELAIAQDEFVYVYGKDGQPTETFELPLGWNGPIALSSRWLARLDSGPSILLVRRADRAAFACTVEGTTPKTSAVLGFSPDERELWLLDLKARKLLRCPLP